MTRMEWVSLDTDADDLSERFEDLVVVNGTLFAIHQSGSLVVKQKNKALKLKRLPIHLLPAESIPRCLAFDPSGQVGYIGILRKQMDVPRIIKTENGGESWVDVSPPVGVGPENGICGITILNDSSVCAVGSYHPDGNNSGVLLSHSAGNDWKQTLAVQSAIDVRFVDSDKGYMVGREDGLPAIWATYTGGRDWSRVTVDVPQYLEGASCWKVFSDGRDVLVSISSERSRSALLLLEAGVDNWVTKEVGVIINNFAMRLGGVMMHDKKTYLGIHNDAMLESTDRINWSEIKDSKGNTIQDVNRIVRVGETLYVAGQKLYNYRPCQITDINSSIS